MKRIIKLEFREDAKKYTKKGSVLWEDFYVSRRPGFVFNILLSPRGNLIVLLDFVPILLHKRAHARRTTSTKRLKFLLSAMPQTHTEIWMFRKSTALTIREPKTFEPFPEINLIVVDQRRNQKRWRTFLSDIRLLAAEVLSLFLRIGQNLFLVETEIRTVAQVTESCGRRARENRKSEEHWLTALIQW